ncbi:GIY-YIG nuclease family protein [Halovulum sp. GXIMD14794]
MRKDERKRAVDAWKERKRPAGIYALRCGSEVWVGATPDLDAVENRLRFTLEMGSHPNADVRAALLGEGAGAFAVERLEVLDEEVPAVARDRVLKERRLHWCDALSAAPL